MKKKKYLPLGCQRYEEKICEYLNAAYTLRERVKEVACKRDVISLYPDGADKDHACADYKDAQYRLLCAIGSVDGRLSEMSQLYTQFSDVLSDYNYISPSHYQKSHNIIEDAYSQYMKGNE